MIKILLAFDGKHFSDGVYNFVKSVNQAQKVMATGVFLPGVDYTELLYSLGGMAGPIYVADWEQEDQNTAAKNMERFEQLCKQDGMEYRVHSNFTKHVVTQLREESRFADMLVLSSEQFYHNMGADIQESYIEKVLHHTECPVILIPENYQPLKSIILAYDGSASSVHAIKQFAYLFPHWKNMQTLLVYFNPKDHEIPERTYIEELVTRHFCDLTIFQMDIDPRKELTKWIVDTGSAMLVAGAYSRSLFSETLRKSFILDVIREHKVPLFVAHR
jgi:hypothetical protein